MSIIRTAQRNKLRSIVSIVSIVSTIKIRNIIIIIIEETFHYLIISSKRYNKSFSFPKKIRIKFQENFLSLIPLTCSKKQVHIPSNSTPPPPHPRNSFSLHKIRTDKRMQPLSPFPPCVSITHTRCSVSRARREGGREVENSEHCTVSERSPKIAAARLI